LKTFVAFVVCGPESENGQPIRNAPDKEEDRGRGRGGERGEAAAPILGDGSAFLSHALDCPLGKVQNFQISMQKFGLFPVFKVVRFGSETFVLVCKICPSFCRSRGTR